MDSQEGIDEVYSLDYFDRTKIVGDINNRSKKPYQPLPVQESEGSSFFPKFGKLSVLLAFFLTFSFLLLIAPKQQFHSYASSIW
jgi:hypothetical protein